MPTNLNKMWQTFLSIDDQFHSLELLVLPKFSSMQQNRNTSSEIIILPFIKSLINLIKPTIFS